MQIGGIDLNNIGFGIYLVQNATNAPDASWWMILSSTQDGTGTQLAKSVISKTVMARDLAANNWCSWYSLHS